MRQPEFLFQPGSVMELVDSDDDEFETLIEAVEDIRILHQRKSANYDYDDKVLNKIHYFYGFKITL